MCNTRSVVAGEAVVIDHADFKAENLWRVLSIEKGVAKLELAALSLGKTSPVQFIEVGRLKVVRGSYLSFFRSTLWFERRDELTRLSACFVIVSLYSYGGLHVTVAWPNWDEWRRLVDGCDVYRWTHTFRL